MGEPTGEQEREAGWGGEGGGCRMLWISGGCCFLEGGDVAGAGARQAGRPLFRNRPLPRRHKPKRVVHPSMEFEEASPASRITNHRITTRLRPCPLPSLRVGEQPSRLPPPPPPTPHHSLPRSPRAQSFLKQEPTSASDHWPCRGSRPMSRDRLRKRARFTRLPLQTRGCTSLEAGLKVCSATFGTSNALRRRRELRSTGSRGSTAGRASSPRESTLSRGAGAFCTSVAGRARHLLFSCTTCRLTGPPSPFPRHTACLYNNKIYVFGGLPREPTVRTNEIMALDLSTHSWSKVRATGQKPESRFQHCAAVDDGYLYVFGGVLNTATVNRELVPLSDLHRFDLRTGMGSQGTWSKIVMLGTNSELPKSSYTCVAPSVGKMFFVGYTPPPGRQQLKVYRCVFLFPCAVESWAGRREVYMPRLTPPRPPADSTRTKRAESSRGSNRRCTEVGATSRPRATTTR